MFAGKYFIRNIFLVLLMSGVLSACGFKPLHGTASDQLLRGDVGFERADGRLGYEIYDALIKEFGTPRSAPRYQLVTTSKVKRTGLAITQTDDITRINYVLTTTYRLMNTETELELTAGEVSAIASYNATASQYATLTSAKEVEKRSAQIIAERIHRRMLAAAQSGKLAQ